MESWELEAREAIRELVASYAHFADGGKFDELVQLFAEDAVLRAGEFPEARGREAIKAFLGGTNRSLSAATRVPLIRHHTSNLSIRLLGPDQAEGSCYFFVVTERGPDHWGRYRDRYARTSGGWLFSYRRARMDGYAPGSWVAERRRGEPG